MEIDKDSSSFGQYLQAIRLKKKISLEKVSQETRIGIEMLKLIEKEDHAHLPAEVFSKGFIRAFARAIGADAQEAVQRYESRLNVLEKLTGSDIDAGSLALGLGWKAMVVFIAYCGLIAGSIQGDFYLRKISSTAGPSAERTAAEKQSDTGLHDQPIADQGQALQAAEGKLVLQIIAREDTWIKAVVDNGDPSEYDLKPGDLLQIEASANYNLLIGNAGGVSLTLNDKAIRLTGKRGEMVNLNLP